MSKPLKFAQSNKTILRRVNLQLISDMNEKKKIKKKP